MSKTKNMTPEQEAVWKEKKRAYDKARREANPEKISAYKIAWKKANREKIRAANKVWREANKEKTSAYTKYLWKHYPDKMRAKSKDSQKKYINKIRERSKKRTELLEDSYVANTMKIAVSECPPELIEYKRQYLLLYRAIKELKKHLTEATE